MLDAAGTPILEGGDLAYIDVAVSAAGTVIVTPVEGVRIRDVRIVVQPPSHYLVAQRELSGGAYDNA